MARLPIILLMTVSCCYVTNSAVVTADEPLSREVRQTKTAANNPPWFLYAQRGFAIIVANLVELRRTVKQNVLQVTQLTKDVRAVEKVVDSQRSENLALVKSSLAQLGTIYPKCPSGWRRRLLKCYKYFQCPSKCTFATARAHCAKYTATLASVRSSEENNFVASLAGSKVLNVMAGGNDIEREGRWLWPDGSRATYFNWDRNQPDNCCGGQDCLVIWKHRANKWDDGTCRHNFPSATSGFVCEKLANAK